MRTLAYGFALILLAAPAHAQTQAAPDSRWSRWIGCWDLVMENAREGAPTPDTAGRESRTAPRDTRPRVCVQASDGGATFSTSVGTQTPIVQTVVADGTDRPISDNGCTGTQRAEWSRDGFRLFSRAELTCKGDQGTRRVSGLALLGPNATWTDVQSIDIGGRESFRVRRYRRADEGRTVPNVTATALTLEDVQEASAKVSPRALEAALVETRASFSLTGKKLIELNKAGVPATVIDLMVALSYPDRFVIERRTPPDVAQAPIINDPFMLGWAFGYPMWSDLYGFYSPLYGSFSPYYYSPFGFPYLRGYDPLYGGYGYSLVGDGGGSNASPRSSGAGRAVDGLGYTRVRPRESEPVTTSNTPGAASTASSAGSSSSGSSGGGSVSSQGFSSGGGGGGGGSSDGGRTAQPR